MNTDPPVSDTQLRALLSDGLPDDETTRLESLLENDPVLRSRLESLSGATQFRSEFSTDSRPPQEEAEVSKDLSDVIDSLKAEQSAQAPSPTPSLIASILSPSEEPGSIGSLGPYEIEGHLATGGMGVVYKARDPKLHRQVAIKVLSPTFAGHNDAMQRFLREATAAAAIEHPNVLPIHAIDTESAELPFLVMRYVDGPSVEKLIADQNGPLDFEQVLAIAKAVSSALGAAHAKDLTHRDIKPSNILLEREKPDQSSESPTIYLTDFGLARIANDTSLTRPGTFLGTPQFSSPEQARGDQADHRSDLFSLGTVLYTMATGASPFSGEDNSLTSVIYRVVHEPHPPTLGVNPSLPAWFAELVDRLLEKEPANRPASAELLTRCLDEESVAPLSDRSLSLRNRPRFLLVALVLIGLLFGTLLILKNRSASEPPEADAGSSQGPDSALKTDQGVTMITGATRQEFPTLAQALEAVEEDSILEIAQDGKIETDPLTTPPGISLTIRAAPGYRPVRFPPKPNLTLLTIRGPLILEGLTLHGDNDNDLLAPPLVSVEAESFSAIGCRFELPTNVRPRRRTITFVPPVFEVTGNAQFHLLNSELVAAGSAGVRFLKPQAASATNISIKNSLLVSSSGLELHHGNSEGSPFEITLERNFFCTRSALIIFGAGEVFPATLHISDTLFTSDTAIIETPKRIRDLYENVEWHGRNNIYSCASLVRPGERSLRPTSRWAQALTTMPQWHFLWRQQDQGSIQHDLEYRKHIGHYLFNPIEINAEILNQVPKSVAPLPTTGPIINEIGPGEPYHRWRAATGN